MTTHELARQLLAGPDEPVYVVNEDDVAPEPVQKLESLAAGEWTHHYTNQPLDNDASGNPLPEHYTVVLA